MKSFVRFSVILAADLFREIIMWVMQTYLTNAWKLSVTHAAGIINVWNGVACFLYIPLAFFADSIIGNFYTLLFSCIIDTIGLVFLTMSTPLFNMGQCNKYEPECIGPTQKTLFYISLALIALGMGRRVSLRPFFQEQEEKQQEEVTNSDTKIAFFSCSLGQQLGCLVVVVATIIGGSVLQFIKSWSIKFGLTALFSLVALLVFLSGLFWHPYIRKGPQGSPLTTIIRVFVAAIYKMSKRIPEDHNNAKNLYMSDDSVQLTGSLRFLDKAAIILPIPEEEQQKKHKWHLCSVREVEDAKTCLEMAPLWIPFILCGLVFSLGNTYFIEQADNMSQKLGRLKVSVIIFRIIFKLFSSGAGFVSGRIYSIVKGWLPVKYKKKFPFFGIAFALITSILCCNTAALVENRRLKLIRSIPELLEDDPPKNIKIPMTMFLLVPQYIFLGVFSGISTTCFTELFNSRYPPCMYKYLEYLLIGIPGIGTAGDYS
ncbi:protein NRT1/ PTR FAMILY 5.5-like [Apium graveolens]|uniref:protein NRT1/ PTR FAMILY 5.5-like n=1 Tax=Apium graveolens TaxID=4045 RepID=UPI003D7B762E